MALVLKRKQNEEILIGSDVRVAILGVKDGGTVSVAITAPKDVQIVRAEIAHSFKPRSAHASGAFDVDAAAGHAANGAEHRSED